MDRMTQARDTWLFTDAHDQVWRLVPTGDPSTPLTITIERRDTGVFICASCLTNYTVRDDGRMYWYCKCSPGTPQRLRTRPAISALAENANATVWVRFIGAAYPRVVTGIYATEAAARAACMASDEAVEPWGVK